MRSGISRGQSNPISNFYYSKYNAPKSIQFWIDLEYQEDSKTELMVNSESDSKTTEGLDHWQEHPMFDYSNNLLPPHLKIYQI